MLEPYYKQAEVLLTEGKWDEARGAFKKAGNYKDAGLRTLEPYYRQAEALMEDGEWDAASNAFSEAGFYKDAASRILEPYYRQGEALLAQGDEEGAIAAFKTAANFKDAATRCQAIYYSQGVRLFGEGKFEESMAAFVQAGDYEDSEARIGECQIAILDRTYDEAIALKNAKQYDEAIKVFRTISKHKDSIEQISACKEGILDVKYDAAVELKNAEKYDEAIAALTDIVPHKDSAEQIEACEAAIIAKKYDEAVALMNAKDYQASHEIFAELGSYLDSAEKAKEADKQARLRKGSSIFFGSYEQDGNSDNGKEDIWWQVLTREDNRVLMVSSLALECRPYHNKNVPITWAECSLRAWLNNDFLNAAFSEEEKKMIPTVTLTSENPKYRTDHGEPTQDKIFLLSIEEAWEYFPDRPHISVQQIQCKPTAYAQMHGVWTSRTGHCWWWLRSVGKTNNSAGQVYYNGSVGLDGVQVNLGDKAVRPAMWIEIPD